MTDTPAPRPRCGATTEVQPLAFGDPDQRSVHPTVHVCAREPDHGGTVHQGGPLHPRPIEYPGHPEPTATWPIAPPAAAAGPDRDWPAGHMVEAAWNLLANCGAFDHPEMASPGWTDAAIAWREAYHHQQAAAPARPPRARDHDRHRGLDTATGPYRVGRDCPWNVYRQLTGEAASKDDPALFDAGNGELAARVVQALNLHRVVEERLAEAGPGQAVQLTVAARPGSGAVRTLVESDEVAQLPLHRRSERSDREVLLTGVMAGLRSFARARAADGGPIDGHELLDRLPPPQPGDLDYRPPPETETPAEAPAETAAEQQADTETGQPPEQQEDSP